MLEEGDGALNRPSYHVHEEIALPEIASPVARAQTEGGTEAGAEPETEAGTEENERSDRAAGSTRPGAALRSVHKPDGNEVKLRAGARTFAETDQPGIYRLRTGEVERYFAVNVSPEETRTAPLEMDQLEQHGVRLRTRADDTDDRQQLRDVELEGRQKLWRWLIAGALGLLIVETWLAGLLARPKKEQHA